MSIDNLINAAVNGICLGIVISLTALLLLDYLPLTH